MRVKCVKCKTVEEIIKEDMEKLINTAKMYNEDIDPNDYTAILSVIKGRCTDGKKHLYIYEEEFSKKIAELITEHNELCENNLNKTSELSDTVKKIESLKDEIKNMDNKRINIIKEIGDIGNDIDNIVETFEKETGTKNMKIWS